MKRVAQFAFSFVMLAALPACDTKSKVEFKGDRLVEVPKKDSVASEVSVSNGGFFRRTTASNFKADITMGAPVNAVSRTTSNGYKVQLNITGQTGH